MIHSPKELVKRPNILVMTATITPPASVPFLARNDPRLRLKDYEESLKFYLPLINQCISTIVFAENSNSDISSLQDLVDRAGFNKQVEFLVFEGLDYPPSYGRAYGEFKLIDYAMEHSQIIKNQDQEAIIWKVTGRYIVKNLCQIIARKPSNFDIYCNFRKVPKPWADMFLLAWTLEGYQDCLYNIYPQLASSYDTCTLHPEEIFIDLLEQRAAKNINIVKRLNPNPMISGIRGSDNQNYLEGRNLLKFYLRSIGQKLFPSLWI